MAISLEIKTIRDITRFITDQSFNQKINLVKTIPFLRAPPLFWPFLDLENGKAARVKIFTTDRTPKITRHVFEEKNLKAGFSGFLWETLVFHRFSPCHCGHPWNFVQLGWNFFWEYLQLYLRGSFQLFQKSHFLFFIKKYVKVFAKTWFLTFKSL